LPQIALHRYWKTNLIHLCLFVVDHQVSNMQKEIDQESANKMQLSQQLKEAESHTARKEIKLALTRSNEKMEALMLLLLQYCAGLQHCLDQEEEMRQRASSATQLRISPSPVRGDKGDVDVEPAGGKGGGGGSGGSIVGDDHRVDASQDDGDPPIPISATPLIPAIPTQTEPDLAEEFLSSTVISSYDFSDVESERGGPCLREGNDGAKGGRAASDAASNADEEVAQVLSELINTADQNDEAELATSDDSSDDDGGDFAEQFRPIVQKEQRNNIASDPDGGDGISFTALNGGSTAERATSLGSETRASNKNNSPRSAKRGKLQSGDFANSLSSLGKIQSGDAAKPSGNRGKLGSGAPSVIDPKAVIKKAKATMEGCSDVCMDSDELEESTSV
jgi:hypothetical protein